MLCCVRFDILIYASTILNPSQKKATIMTQSARGESLDKSTDSMLDNKLWLKILIGMALGVVVGVIISPQGLGVVSEDLAFTLASWIKLPGTIFLGMIQMVIVPLIICSIILGIADGHNLGSIRRLGVRIVPYFLITTSISIAIGITLVTLINPGSYIDETLFQHAMNMQGNSADTPVTFSDLTIPERIANLIPANPAQAQLDKNMLQIVIASIFVGVALASINAKNGKPFRDLCMSGQMITMRIISWAMLIAPYAVFGLLCDITIRIGLEALLSVGVYMLTVLGGLISMVGVYLVIVMLFGRISPWAFLKHIRAVQLLAFSTSSSAATMPFTIKAAEENLNIREDISRFVIPLGATINMDGTAMYQAIAALFLCQIFGVELTMAETVILLLTTVGASIGTPATPGVGIIVLATILVGIGVPAEGIALIIGVDRILDMCRTTVNVTGDLTASIVMQRLLPQKPKALEPS